MDSIIIHLPLPPEYRSAIFYHTPEQYQTAKEVTAAVQKKHFDPKGRTDQHNVLLTTYSYVLHSFYTGKTIVTQIVEAGPWWEAEDYHQLYLHNNPSGYQCPTHTLHW